MKYELALAISIASTKHMGQFDKGGNPYILHPLKVMYYLKSSDFQLMAIAVLHDIVEDTGTTYEELRTAGISERVLEGIRVLTKLPGQTAYEYLAAVTSNKDAVLVKMADLRHNMDVRRLKGVRPKDMERLARYADMYHVLETLV